MAVYSTDKARDVQAPKKKMLIVMSTLLMRTRELRMTKRPRASHPVEAVGRSRKTIRDF